MNTEETTIDILSECINQIDYMQRKFTATGTGNSVLVRARVLLESLERSHGLGVPQGSPEDRSEAESECGPAQSATPKESIICVEELEKEGWEKFLGPYTHQYTKGEIAVEFGKGEIEIWVDDTKAKNCKTMPDLRTLELLVNGPQK